MIPSYLILAKLGLINSLWGLVIFSAVDAFGIFMMRQFCETLPGELLDAGRIDGASEWQIFFRIVLPQLKPALATLGILVFMNNWNAYLWPMIVLQKVEVRTLPVILTWFQLHLHRPARADYGRDGAHRHPNPAGLRQLPALDCAGLHLFRLQIGGR
jgi:ABC-type glycerol-3-phosphate transport system permease component